MVNFRLFRKNDIEKISSYLACLDKSNIELNNCRKVIWNCISKHPCFEMFHPEKTGIWENDDEIVGVVRLESPCYGGVIIDANPEFPELYSDMIRYAEETFAGSEDSGNRYLNIFVRDSDKLRDNLKAKEYSKGAEGRMLLFDLPEPIPVTGIPEGFQIKPLGEVFDFDKLNELLWRAFNYEGEPPSYDDDVYLPIKHAWLDYRREICMVAVAPDKSYAAFCGMWFDSDTKSALIEPMATAQRFRNLGLARSCIHESVKRCKELGAGRVFVEPDERALEWYKKIGFKQAYKSYCWSKRKL